MNRRWLILIVGLFAMIAGCAYQYGLPYLIPALRADRGLTLREAAVVISCPVAGLLVALTLWGIAADRWGERIILCTGLSIAGLALLAASTTSASTALGGCFFVAGAGGASLLAGCCLGAALLVASFARDPERPEAGEGHHGGSPYRTPVLWRIHAASALLVVPQFAVSAFALVCVVDARGWAAATAGRVLAVAQVGGAVARLVVGLWSDRVGSRVRPMRLLAVAIGGIMVVLAAGALSGREVATFALLAAG